jgi:hypothetical protein
MTSFPKYFNSVRLAVDETYMISDGIRIRMAKLVHSSPRGFNFQDVVTFKNLFKKHLYPVEPYRDAAVLTFWIPDAFTIELKKERVVPNPLEKPRKKTDLDRFIEFLKKEGYEIVMKNPRHVPGQGYSAPEYYGDVDIDHALKQFNTNMKDGKSN